MAKLAGVPDDVLALARDKLAQLEAGKLHIETVSSPAQDDLFSNPAEHPALAKLKEIDPDSLTPRAALDLLYELRKQF